MTFLFGDSFDFYALASDAGNGFWDSMASPAGAPSIVTGRFTGSRAIALGNTGTLTKSSGSNDATHHIVLAYVQTSALTGTAIGGYITFSDIAAAQCTIAFRTDGAILLQSGAVGGATLATYTGAVTSTSAWIAFEFELVINNTTGSIAVRKNGNTSNDFSLGSLNTRAGSSNNYANKITLGCNSATNPCVDDFMWFNTSGSAPNTWVGDIRAYQRMPASDASVQYSKFPNPVVLTISTNTNVARSASTVILTPFVPTVSGTLTTGTLNINTGATANMKVAIYDSGFNLVGSGGTVTNPVLGNNSFTLTSAATVTSGSTYYLATDQDASVTYNITNALPSTAYTLTTVLGSFPPTISTTPATTAFGNSGSLNIVPLNASLVGEFQQDGLTTYVFDSTAGDADFYNLTALGVTPASIIAVTTRAYMQKSDAGFRTAAVRLKSSSTTVSSPTLNLSTSFQWTWRSDAVDPNTSAAWTVSGINAATLGPVTVS